MVTAEELRDVIHIEATSCTFAAMLANGTLVTWGDSKKGGDSSGLKTQLQNVYKVKGNRSAFTAILWNGSIVSWGDKSCGGKVSSLNSARFAPSLHRTSQAFSAILQDGSIVCWGQGGNCAAVEHNLSTVKWVYANQCASAAVLEDGCNVAWGSGQSAQTREMAVKHQIMFKETMSGVEWFLPLPAL